MENDFTLFIKSLSAPKGALSIYETIFSLSLAYLLTRIVVFHYSKLNNSRANDQNFELALILLGIVATFIMQTVGNSIARAFSLAGALSIVRFRNAIKDSVDIAAIFFVMAIGISCGSQFWSLSVISTVLICFFWWFSIKTIHFTQVDNIVLFSFNASSAEYFEAFIDQKTIKYIKICSLKSTSIISDNNYNFVYELHLNKLISGVEILNDFKEKTDNDKLKDLQVLFDNFQSS